MNIVTDLKQNVDDVHKLLKEKLYETMSDLDSQDLCERFNIDIHTLVESAVSDRINKMSVSELIEAL